MASERIQRRIDRLLDQVEELADQREWSQVKDLSEEIIQLDADNADAKTFLDLAQLRLSSSPSQPQADGIEHVDRSIPGGPDYQGILAWRHIREDLERTRRGWPERLYGLLSSW